MTGHGKSPALPRALDRLDLEIGSEQTIRYSDMEPIGPNEIENLAILVPLTSLILHLEELRLGISGPVDGELIVVAGLEVHVCPLNQVSVIDLSSRFLTGSIRMNC